MDKEEILLYEYKIDDILGTIYAPLVKEVLQLKEEGFNKIIFPFTLRIEDFNIPKEYKEVLTVFETLFVYRDKDEEKDLLTNLIKGLKFFYKTNDVVAYKQGYILINKKNVVNKENFQKLSDKILEFCMVQLKSKKKEDIKLQYETEKGREALMEIMRLREEFQEKNNKPISLFQLINIVVHGMRWIYKDVLEFTYAQLINSYKFYTKKENYYIFMDYKTSGNFDIKNDIQHWSEESEE